MLRRLHGRTDDHESPLRGGRSSGGHAGHWRCGMELARSCNVRHGGRSGARLCGANGTGGARLRAVVVYEAHAGGAHASRGPVAAISNDAAASAHARVGPVVGRSQRNQRLHMMNQTGAWMGGWSASCPTSNRAFTTIASIKPRARNRIRLAPMAPHDWQQAQQDCHHGHHPGLICSPIRRMPGSAQRTRRVHVDLEYRKNETT